MFRYYFIIIILCLIFLLRKTSFGSKFANNYSYINDDTRRVCDELYLFEENQKIKVINNFLTLDECNKLIKEINNFSKKHGWSKNRHKYYSTTDNQFTKKWINYSLIKNKVKDIIYPQLEKMYKVKKSKLNINEMFVVKYSKEGQRELDFHKDGSEFSFIIGLNDDYKGGGTYFFDLDKNIKLRKGSCLIFSGQNTHKGSYLLEGTRYILTGFISYGGTSTCQEYYKNIFEITE